MHQDIKEILLTEEQIAARVRELGAQITKDYAGKTILLCGILKGAVTFFTDLARAIDGPVYFDFMSCSSYGASTESWVTSKSAKTSITTSKGKMSSSSKTSSIRALP